MNWKGQNMLKIENKLFAIIWTICFVWLILAVNQQMSYELGVNDCSNMVYRSEQIFDMFRIDTMIGEKSMGDGYTHVWIIVDVFGYSIPYETTTLLPGLDFWNYEPDRVFSNVSEIVNTYPSLKSEYV